MNQGKRRRSIKNYFINPNFQIKYALNLVGVGLIAIGLNCLLVLRKIDGFIDNLALIHFPDAYVQKRMAEVFFDISLQSVMAFLLTVILSFIFAVVMSHRVAGAAYAIEKYINDIKNGEFDENRQLRKNDDLQSVMAALRGLAATLKSKGKS